MRIKLTFIIILIPNLFILLGTLKTGEALLYNSTLLAGFIFSIICTIGMGIFVSLMPKRNPYGNEILGKIRGFRNFLVTARKEELERMVLENPTYFYDILPYTYVLGISKKWINKFESIAIKEPDWYMGHTAFSISSFGVSIDTALNRADVMMSSAPSSGGSSSGGGGSSGGGSSGGGSGGGGGGSW